MPHESPRLLVVCGGTGGHIFPALALYEELMSRETRFEVLFVGAEGGMEEDLVKSWGARAALLRLPRPRLFERETPAHLFRACVASRRIIRAFRPHLIVATGGYVTVPVLFAAASMRIPYVLLEANAIPGRANRMFSMAAREVCVQFASSAGYFPRFVNITVSGEPVRSEIRKAGRVRMKRPPGRTVLVLGGALGASAMNRFFAEALPLLARAVKGLRVYHQTGGKDARLVADAFERSGVEGEWFDFSGAIARYYERAALVVSRAGASTVAELVSCGLPAVLVPYPHARDDHQNANALAMESSGAAVRIAEGSLSGVGLASLVAGLLNDPSKLQRMGAASRAMGRPEAASIIADRLEERLAPYLRTKRMFYCA